MASSKQISIRIDLKLLTKVEKWAKANNRTRNNAIETLVIDGLGANQNFNLLGEKSK